MTGFIKYAFRNFPVFQAFATFSKEYLERVFNQINVNSLPSLRLLVLLLIIIN
jgi:hypothetical protein